ncbi:hypothetical protein AMAG_01634 [Allomyces macrogynus ATCC 38327]|uniref:Peptidase C14 caspase domain-containing protein n=1 Tax=Allomyces macrogynus (strain ATCC 38327) TaxID=578462 RepID=A0A0L0RZA2_ALLM3|nr:hypothetical protein AMAG_01634 [Allomyces macrogynus ATCC 38327]|eukprot:KNE55757.1 hypothetical protein AMAG_01634 [Allomyces macrogynus ATCC 38327]
MPFPGFSSPSYHNNQQQQQQPQQQQPPQYGYQQPPPQQYGYQAPPQQQQYGYQQQQPQQPQYGTPQASPYGYNGQQQPMPMPGYGQQPPQYQQQPGQYQQPPALPPRMPPPMQAAQQSPYPAYGPGSAPAPYQTNQVPYPAPLPYNINPVPLPTQNVPALPPNVVMVNDVPRLTGRKKALLIGINYFGQQNELRGCITDVQNMYKFLTGTYGFVDSPETMVVLTDIPSNRDPWKIPTKRSIVTAMQWLVAGAQPGDSLFLHYSGHGGHTEDLDGDEDDGHDETIYPVDHAKSGMLTDDEMHAILVKPLPPGVKLTVVFDSCHSGTALDLPFIYLPDGRCKTRATGIKKAGETAKQFGKDLMTRGSLGAALGLATTLMAAARAKPAERVTAEKTSQADVVMFSGCKDSQTSADATIQGQATGAMSWALLQALRAAPMQSYAQIIASTRDLLRGKYHQIPQLSAGRQIDINQLFVL